MTMTSSADYASIMEKGFRMYYNGEWAFLEHYACILDKTDWPVKPSASKGKCNVCDKNVPEGLWGVFNLYRAGLK